MAMRKIAIVSQKGGVGKTTTTLSIGAGLSRIGKKCLVIDLDPQGSIATSVLDENEKGIFEYLIYDAPLESCITHMGANLNLMTSNKELQKMDVLFLKKPKPSVSLIEKLSKIDGFDYLLLDLAPAYSELNRQAIRFCDEVILPVSTDYLGYDALLKTIQTINEINEEYNLNVKISKIVPTMYDQRLKLSKEIFSLIESNYYTLTSNPIRVDSKLKEAPKAKKSIFNYAPSSKGAKDYAELVKRIVQDEGNIVQKKILKEKIIAVN